MELCLWSEEFLLLHVLCEEILPLADFEHSLSQLLPQLFGNRAPDKRGY